MSLKSKKTCRFLSFCLGYYLHVLNVFISENFLFFPVQIEINLNAFRHPKEWKAALVAMTTNAAPSSSKYPSALATRWTRMKWRVHKVKINSAKRLLYNWEVKWNSHVGCTETNIEGLLQLGSAGSENYKSDHQTHQWSKGEVHHPAS